MDLSDGLYRPTETDIGPVPAHPSLFNSIYEHPKETAILATTAVATLAAAGAALYLSRGRILAAGLKDGAEASMDFASPSIPVTQFGALDEMTGAARQFKDITILGPKPIKASSAVIGDSAPDETRVLSQKATGKKLGEKTKIESAAVKGYGFSFRDNFDIKALRQGKAPVDYKQLIPKDSKVVLFGEIHPISESRYELIDNMGQFKQMKFTHLAMEALNKKRQPLLDAFFAGSHPNATAAAIAKSLRKDWGWDTPSYVKLIEEAKANGIKVLSTDKNVPKALVKSWEKAGKYGMESRAREKQWSEIITAQVKKDPNARLLMLAGKGHTGIDSKQTNYLTSILKRNKLKPFAIDLASGGLRGASNFEMAVRQAGLVKERFAVPIVQPGFRPADIVVNMPVRSGSSSFTDPYAMLTTSMEKAASFFGSDMTGELGWEEGYDFTPMV